MIDIFKLFRVEYREDIYTYCLKSMLDSGTNEFRRRVGAQFGFDDAFRFTREAYALSPNDGGANRKNITPDLILYNERRIAIIESKMFSTEGYLQTKAYERGVNDIKRKLDICEADVSFYYLTLAGTKAESESFRLALPVGGKRAPFPRRERERKPGAGAPPGKGGRGTGPGAPPGKREGGAASPRRGRKIFRSGATFRPGRLCYGCGRWKREIQRRRGGDLPPALADRLERVPLLPSLCAGRRGRGAGRFSEACADGAGL